MRIAERDTVCSGLRRASAAVFLALAVLSGCGRNETADLGTPIEVTGKVSMDGRPAAGIEVILSRVTPGAPAKDASYVAKTDDAGVFQIANVYPAEYQAMFNDRSSEDLSKNLALESGPYEKYGQDSSVVAKVDENHRELSFDLTSKP